MYENFILIPINALIFHGNENFVGRRSNEEYELSQKDFTVASESWQSYTVDWGLHKYHLHIPLVLRCQNQTGPYNGPGWKDFQVSVVWFINHPVPIYLERFKETLHRVLKI